MPRPHSKFQEFMKRHFKVILPLASHVYSAPDQCCSTLDQAVTSQAGNKIHFKGLFLVFLTEYMLEFDVFRINKCIFF